MPHQFLVSGLFFLVCSWVVRCRNMYNYKFCSNRIFCAFFFSYNCTWMPCDLIKLFKSIIWVDLKLTMTFCCIPSQTKEEKDIHTICSVCMNDKKHCIDPIKWHLRFNVRKRRAIQMDLRMLAGKTSMKLKWISNKLLVVKNKKTTMQSMSCIFRHEASGWKN